MAWDRKYFDTDEEYQKFQQLEKAVQGSTKDGWFPGKNEPHEQEDVAGEEDVNI